MLLEGLASSGVESGKEHGSDCKGLAEGVVWEGLEKNMEATIGFWLQG